jgi:OmcA/MtrC family decaheme c-type cytochrome
MINEKQSMYLAVIAIVISVLAVGITYTSESPMGLQGIAGPAGADGAAGAVGAVGPAGPAGVVPVMDAEPESCIVCHKEAGSEHQADYDDYVNESNLAITIDSVSTTGSTSVMKVTIMKDGELYVEDDLSGLDQARFYAVDYDSVTNMFTNAGYVRFTTVAALGSGQYSVTASDVDYDIETSDAIAYAYIAQSPLDVEQGGSHVHLYDDVADAGISYGDSDEYESAAVVSGCVKCHGEPYGKHGYRQAEVEGLSDFASCKVCHYDDRNGGHEDWQIFADDPARYAEVHAGDDLTAEEETQYAYKANIMNDVHMSHAMEFPYPQSMANCVTCHEGKLDMILTDDNFQTETCKSCHPVTGQVGLDADGEELYDTTEYALATVLPAVHDSMDLDATDCTSCHNAAGALPVFSDIHTGYDKQVYTADGVMYSDSVVITIDEASVSNDVVTVKFSATSDLAAIDVEDIAPTVMVGMYGWDTKDYIIGPHERLVDDNNDGEISRSSGDDRALEYGVGDDHPRGTTVSASGGMWEVTIDMSTWGGLIDDGTVSRIEIAVMGELVDVDDVELAIDAVSKTYDLATGEFVNYYDPITNVEGCNTCHEALGITFHGPDRGGSIVVCRMCHITKSDGSHLEMQSRSIDSYVHAIHSFQAFDIGDVDFTNDAVATKYDVHVQHTMPLFTIKNCEACHNEGTYEVPDQTKSLPGLLSASDSLTGRDRNIGDVPEVATGPGARACGACHRADAIAADDASKLASLYVHFENGGYEIEVVDDELATITDVIYDIMANFE